jgi:hypothetical protein
LDVDNGYLSSVAWSRDGLTLFAAGRYKRTIDSAPVLAWPGDGADPTTGTDGRGKHGDELGDTARRRPAGRISRPLVRTAGAGGHAALAADLRDEAERLSVSADGGRIGFHFGVSGKSPARFDLTSRVLTAGAFTDPGMEVPRQTGLPVENWYNQYRPTLGGKPLPLEPYERSRSLAVDPKGERFVLGTNWSLRAFDAQGMPLWTRTEPGAVWAVNITGDGRLVVAACDDGTIRWHRMSDGGAPGTRNAACSRPGRDGGAQPGGHAAHQQPRAARRAAASARHRHQRL